MHTYYDVKEMLHDELAEIVEKGELSAGSLETIDKLLNSIKNSCKIIMYEEYSEDGYSNDGGYSNARGRGRNARRDSMGRYAREDGYSNEGGYSNRRGGYSREGGYSNRRGGRYSYAEEKEDKISMLQEMMNEANTEQEKSMLRNLIAQMQNN